MQFSKIGDIQLSRYGLGTKRLPTEDSSRVVRMDKVAADGIFSAAFDKGVNFIDTSYSDIKGEAEHFIGEKIAEVSQAVYVATSFLELVDPRYDYVFQKQQKKLQRTCIDFYYVDGVSDLTRMRDIDNGAVDFLFARKEAGEIGMLGFSGNLSLENLRDYIRRYPWDFIRIPVNFFEWFEHGLREKYEFLAEAGLPIIAHAPLRSGAATHLKPEALKILKEANRRRSSIDWGLRFVKSLDGVVAVTSNIYSVEQLEMNASVFEDDAVLGSADMDVLEKAAKAQRTIVSGKA